ncbi:MAG: response regulator [Chloroflexota bacterium]
MTARVRLQTLAELQADALAEMRADLRAWPASPRDGGSGRRAAHAPRCAAGPDGRRRGVAEADDEGRLPGEIEAALFFRVARFRAHNVVKHASRIRPAHVHGARAPSSMSVTTGAGFDPAPRPRRHARLGTEKLGGIDLGVADERQGAGNADPWRCRCPRRSRRALRPAAARADAGAGAAGRQPDFHRRSRSHRTPEEPDDETDIATSRICVLVVDDHEVFCTPGMRVPDLLADIEIVGEAGDGSEAVAMSRRLTPDVILKDLLMPVMDGLTAIGRIKAELLETEIGDDELLKRRRSPPRSRRARAATC